jgi:hypothetical protein
MVTHQKQNKKNRAMYQKLTPAILTTGEQRSGGLGFEDSPKKCCARPYHKNTQQQKGAG